MARLQLDSVVHDYYRGHQPVRALDGVSLSIEEGQCVSVLGPSGSGKSTLLHLMGALDAPSSGRVLLDGTELGTLNDDQLSDLRRKRVGFIFQFFNLLPALTAWENVAVPRLLDGEKLGDVREEAVALLEKVGIGKRADHRPGEMSGGQMQRVAIARSLIMDPTILLADEPTGNLDTRTGDELLDLLAGLAHDDARRSVVMVTHSMDAALRSDRSVLLTDGDIVSDGVPEDVVAKFIGDGRAR
ncbi:ABC transporter ATP-binding protein [Streptomyces sp. AJS327]|uniref:ABC transporter ATP-binding protein n=1 Tax=Streptomyces sp. AJS327 TaxID=2545265 RepID=UPI0015E033BF|nr:ABC transporter ATP-binding protein [Streptomyces sp. AJS327]MBA0049536.1 ABC transporter ATP-binding protein [Streptomyces sp. AJS327]QTC09991.1 ABC transporter ATP-binding protein [Streptomyces sp.]